MKTSKHSCGCVSEVGDRERWVSMCPEHETEFQAIHQRWAQEHTSKQPASELAVGRKLKLDDLK